MRELYTERLHLRYITEADTQRIFDCWASDPEVSKYVTWNYHENIDQTKGYVAFILEEYKKADTYRWGIELTATGELIGMIDVVGYHNGEPVLGYCSGKAYWGKGYMTEALKAVDDALFDDGFDIIRICAVDENIGSNRVIQKAGYIHTAAVTDHFEQKGKDFTVNWYKLERAKQ